MIDPTPKWWNTVEPVRASSRDLLDNSYWAIQAAIVNQRGQTSYTGVVYGIDMWQGAPADGVVTVTTGGLKLSVGTRIAQRLEFPPVSRTVTLSILVDNTLITESWVWNSSAAYTALKTLHGWRLAYQGSGSNMLQIFNVGGNADDLLKAAKLELGSVQTLAHQENGVWVLNDPPPDYGQELAKCQRYFIRWRQYEKAGNAFAVAANLAYGLVPIPKMRTDPAIAYSKFTLSSDSCPVTGVTLSDSGPNNVELRLTTTATLTVGSVYTIRPGSGGYLDFDANL